MEITIPRHDILTYISTKIPWPRGDGGVGEEAAAPEMRVACLSCHREPMSSGFHLAFSHVLSR